MVGTITGLMKIASRRCQDVSTGKKYPLCTRTAKPLPAEAAYSREPVVPLEEYRAGTSFRR